MSSGLRLGVPEAPPCLNGDIQSHVSFLQLPPSAAFLQLLSRLRRPPLIPPLDSSYFFLLLTSPLDLSSSLPTPTAIPPPLTLSSYSSSCGFLVLLSCFLAPPLDLNSCPPDLTATLLPPTLSPDFSSSGFPSLLSCFLAPLLDPSSCLPNRTATLLSPSLSDPSYLLSLSTSFFLIHTRY